MKEAIHVVAAFECEYKESVDASSDIAHRSAMLTPTWEGGEGLHGDQGGEVAAVVGEQQRGPVALRRGHLQGQVDAAEGDGGQGLAVRVLPVCVRDG